MRRILILLTLAIGIVAFPSNSFSFNIEGNLTPDWGVTPGLYGFSDWVPNAGIQYNQEDQNSNYLYPGTGGQLFDAEAMYAAFDSTNLYYAVVTGFPYGGTSEYKPGDIAFDFGKDGSYEYGIETRSGGTRVQGGLYSVTSWGSGLYGALSAPTEILSTSNYWGAGSLVYNNTYYGSSGSGSHLVIEGSIPLSMFGSYAGQDFRMHWTQTCGNDAIDLDVHNNIIPEPATASLLGLGLTGLLFRMRKKSV
jgi:hypothetical protein